MVEATAPGANVWGPARQGDVFHAVRDHGARVIGLIDGAFLDVPAVWHREILWALKSGVRVFGAASMGALRAAELHSFGMQGVGTIFEAYRSGVLPGWAETFEDDDEVAVVHAPKELGYRPLSDAMVDIRFTLAEAVGSGVLTEGSRDALAARMKALHFPDRRMERLKEIAAELGHAHLVGWLDGPKLSLKALDAVCMLQAMRQENDAAAPPFQLQQALTWSRFVASSRRLGQREREALVAVGQNPGSLAGLEREALGRMDSLRAHTAGLKGSRALSAFFGDKGLESREAIVAWASDNKIDYATVLRLAEEEALLQSAVRHSRGAAMDGAIADLLILKEQLASTSRGAQ